MSKFSKILITGFIIANLIKPAFALYHQEYLNKIFSQNLQPSINLNEIEYSKDLEAWLNQSEIIINQRLSNRIPAKLILDVDSNGYIESIDLLETQENDTEKFKNIIAILSNIKFPSLPNDLGDKYLRLTLDLSFLYFERPVVNYLTEADDLKIQNQTKSNLSELIQELNSLHSLETELVDPETIIYLNTGDRITLRVTDKALSDEFKEIKLKAHILNSNRSQSLIEVYAIENNAISSNTKLQYELNHNINKKIFTAELINSSLNSAMQGGIINAISSYGIVPASLAILTASGKAMQLEESSNAINLCKGDLVIINKREKK